MIDFRSLRYDDISSLQCPDCRIPLLSDRGDKKLVCSSCSFAIWFYLGRVRTVRYREFNFDLTSPKIISALYQPHEWHLDAIDLGSVPSIDLETVSRLRKLMILR